MIWAAHMHNDEGGTHGEHTYTNQAIDEETVKGPHLHNHRPRTYEKVAVGHKASGGSFLPMSGDSECGPSNEMSTGCRWGGKEPRTGVERQRVVWGGS